MNSFYELFESVVNANPKKNAINDITYKELLTLVNTSSYEKVTKHNDYNVLIDILIAAKFNRPLVIPPKDGIDFEIPENLSDSFGIYLYTSGSTGFRKSIFIPESMLLSNAKVAIDIQSITSNDIVYNVCSMNHTGGLNAQVIPALLSGCSIIIEEFDTFKFNNRIKETNATITHIVPKMLLTLRKVEKHQLRLVAAGSDCIYREYVEKYLRVGVPFMINYGMSEAGPIIINHIFKSLGELSIFDNGIPLGDMVHCEYKIVDQELCLKGNNTNTDGWLYTGDCVTQIDDWLYYNGRKSAGCKLVKKRY